MRLTGSGLSKAGAVGFLLYIIVLLLHLQPGLVVGRRATQVRSEDALSLGEPNTHAPDVADEEDVWKPQLETYGNVKSPLGNRRSG